MDDETCWSEFDVGLGGEGEEVGGRRELEGGGVGGRGQGNAVVRSKLVTGVVLLCKVICVEKMLRKAGDKTWAWRVWAWFR